MLIYSTNIYQHHCYSSLVDKNLNNFVQTRKSKCLTYVLLLRSHTSMEPSLTQANTVELRGDQHTSGTAF